MVLNNEKFNWQVSNQLMGRWLCHHGKKTLKRDNFFFVQGKKKLIKLWNKLMVNHMIYSENFYLNANHLKIINEINFFILIFWIKIFQKKTKNFRSIRTLSKVVYLVSSSGLGVCIQKKRLEKSLNHKTMLFEHFFHVLEQYFKEIFEMIHSSE